MSTTPKIVLHWLEKSRSDRVLWLLHELKLPYELKLYRRDPVTQRADPALKKVHPLGKSPVIEVDGKVIAESGLICDYLVTKFGKDSELAPKSEQEAWDVKYYLHHSESSLMTPFLLYYISSAARKSSPFLVKPLVSAFTNKMDSMYAIPELKLNLEFLNNRLKENGTGYFVGDHLTGADIIDIFPLSGALEFFPEYPEISKWVELMKKRPAYLAAQQAVKDAEAAPSA